MAEQQQRNKSAKNELQEFCDRNKIPRPIYKEEKSGPGHQPAFKGKVKVAECEFEIEEFAPTKRQAQDLVAKRALAYLETVKEEIAPTYTPPKDFSYFLLVDVETVPHIVDHPTAFIVGYASIFNPVFDRREQYDRECAMTWTSSAIEGTAAAMIAQKVAEIRLNPVTSKMPIMVASKTQIGCILQHITQRVFAVPDTNYLKYLETLES